MNKFQKKLKGGDLGSIGKANEVVSMVKSQEEFDELFSCLNNPERIIVMRAMDAIEKITRENSDYLKNHKKEILTLIQTTANIEIKWHLALVVSRLDLHLDEFKEVWETLNQWAKNKNESKIVRVNSIQKFI